MTQYIDKDALVAEIEKLVNKGRYHEEYDCAYRDGNNGALYALKSKLDTLEVKEDLEIDEKHKIGKWFTGLIPCWVDAPSILQAAHSHHGENIIAIHLKDGGYRCCCVDDKEPTTFSLAENTPLVEGWHNRENNINKVLIQQTLNKARDLANTIEGALVGEEPYPDTYYRMCQDIIECLTKIKKIV